MKRAGGFTLIESLVALSILAIALIAVLKAAGSMHNQQAELLRRMEAQWSLENTATFLRLSNSFPAAGRQRFPCLQGRAGLMCSLTVTATANPGFRRVEIRVTESSAAADDSRQLAQMTIFLARVP
ncbi:MAG: type II secretion system minor pseudopilin GspI [Burkholderiaceae bacterium]